MKHRKRDRMNYELVKVSGESDWRAYHSLRHHVLWVLRGRSDYDATRSDERKAANHPLPLKLDGRPIVRPGSMTQEMGEALSGWWQSPPMFSVWAMAVPCRR